jgi:threonine aldolase
VSLEQTHNVAGGTIWPLPQYRAVVEAAHAVGLPVHVDGARLYNAVVASGVDAAVWGGMVESIWVDLTKGLGAPMGAVLAGSREFIERARPFKHRFGGAMRQAGFAAAGCLHALHHHVDRLAEDHANAQRLAKGLEQLGLAVEEQPDTNILFFAPPPTMTAAALDAALAARGVRVSVLGNRCRAVTHLDVTADDIDDALGAMAGVIAGEPVSRRG